MGFRNLELLKIIYRNQRKTHPLPISWRILSNLYLIHMEKLGISELVGPLSKNQLSSRMGRLMKRGFIIKIDSFPEGESRTYIIPKEFHDILESLLSSDTLQKDITPQSPVKHERKSIPSPTKHFKITSPLEQQCFEEIKEQLEEIPHADITDDIVQMVLDHVYPVITITDTKLKNTIVASLFKGGEEMVDEEVLELIGSMCKTIRGIAKQYSELQKEQQTQKK